MVDIHRFTNEWEKIASLSLRHGRTEVIDTYLEQGRVHGGDEEAMIDAAYNTWRTDTHNGHASVLIAESGQTVTTLNDRARADLILDGTLRPSKEVELNDGTLAGVGDTIITRHNDRRLRSGGAWVRNGDRWKITRVRDDGSITIQRASRRFGGAIVLPAAYVSEFVDLGYAVTAHRAQGITTDTAHTVATSRSTRENFYVSSRCSGSDAPRFQRRWVATSSASCASRRMTCPELRPRRRSVGTTHQGSGPGKRAPLARARGVDRS